MTSSNFTHFMSVIKKWIIYYKIYVWTNQISNFFQAHPIDLLCFGGTITDEIHLSICVMIFKISPKANLLEIYLHLNSFPFLLTDLNLFGWFALELYRLSNDNFFLSFFLPFCNWNKCKHSLTHSLTLWIWKQETNHLKNDFFCRNHASELFEPLKRRHSIKYRSWKLCHFLNRIWWIFVLVFNCFDWD